MPVNPRIFGTANTLQIDSFQFSFDQVVEIRELENRVEQLKVEARRRLLTNIDNRSIINSPTIMCLTFEHSTLTDHIITYLSVNSKIMGCLCLLTSYAAMATLKERHEAQMEPLTRQSVHSTNNEICISMYEHLK